MSPPRSRRPRQYAALLGLALSVTACASPDTTSTPSPSAAATAASTPARTPRPSDPFALAASYEAASPEDLAQRITEAEAAIATGRDLREQALVQQAAYRQLVAMPEWREEVYAELDGSVRATAQANVRAGAELRELTAPREALPPWEIVEPPSSATLRTAYEDAEREFGVRWGYLAAIHLVETRMGRIRGDSTAGARGPMQFLPSTWEAYGEGDIHDPHDAIRAAARYLIAHGAPDDMDRALYAYNHSDHYVRAISIYADRMHEQGSAYDAYYHWQVYYRTTRGDALLYEGWPKR